MEFDPGDGGCEIIDDDDMIQALLMQKELLSLTSPGPHQDGPAASGLRGAHIALGVADQDAARQVETQLARGLRQSHPSSGRCGQ